MTESEFLALAESTLTTIETALEDIADNTDIDIECKRSGNVLEVELADSNTKIIINSQAPMKEMWIAAKSGGFHYKRAGDQWINTRDGSELFAALSAMVSSQTGETVTLTA
ncbi:MAG: iron donor protein CyaY [Janthinobacterium lividum]